MLLCLMGEGGGYPIKTWSGGVPRPRSGWGGGDTPGLDGGGYPIQGLDRPKPGWGVPQVPPTIQTWLGGYPGYLPPPRPGMGYPLPSRPGRDTPTQNWDGVLPRPGMGYPPPTHRPGTGYPPPHKCGQTENITFPHPSDEGGKNSKPFIYLI